ARYCIMSADGGDKRQADVRATPAQAMKPEAPRAPAVSPEEPPKKDNRRRIILMASVPVLLVLIGGWLYLTGGRYASTDNAYVQAGWSRHGADRALAQAKEHGVSTLSAVGGDASIKAEDHRLVLAAQARRDQAALDLANTVVTAPAAGVIAQADRLLVGQQI